MQQNLDPGIRKGFSDEPDNTHIVFQILRRIVGNFLAVVFFKESGVNFLLRRLQLRANVVLFSNKNQLPRRRVIVVLEEIMHPKPEILEIKFRKILAVDRVWIKIVVLQVTPILASFLVFAPKKSATEQNKRGNDGCDYINRNITTESFQHTPIVAELCGDRIRFERDAQPPSLTYGLTNKAPLGPAQGETIVRRLPQAQSDQTLLKAAVDFRPESAHDIFAGRRLLAKFISLEIEMFIAPGRQGLFQSVMQIFEIGQRAGTLIVFATYCRFHDVTVSMPARVVTLAKQLGILDVGK